MTEAAPVTMHIGELAEKTGLSLRTIRHYDEVGLLKPTGRTDGGFRLYTPDDLTRLMIIRRMKPLGFSLEEMTDLLRIIDTLNSGSAGSDDPAVRAELAEFVDLASERRERLDEQLAMADEFLELLRRLGLRAEGHRAEGVRRDGGAAAAESESAASESAGGEFAASRFAGPGLRSAARRCSPSS